MSRSSKTTHKKHNENKPCNNASPSNLHKPDEMSELLVHGYIERSTENFPRPIIMICLSYYFDPEYFEIVGNCCELSDDSKAVTYMELGGWNNTTYGHQWIESNTNNMIKWRFKVLAGSEKYTCIVIGISSADTVTTDTFYDRMNSLSYMYKNDARKGSINTFADYGEKYGKDDIISMILNLKTQKLSFYKNETNLGCAYDNIPKGIDIRYKSAVCFARQAALRIIDFEHTHQE